MDAQEWAVNKMADYIDRQAAIDAVSDLPTWYGDSGCLPFRDPQPPMEALMYPEDVVSAINNLPCADVVEVVRCKDCGYRDNNGYCEHLGIEWFIDDDFCPYGWRVDWKDGDGEQDG